MRVFDSVCKITLAPSDAHELHKLCEKTSVFLDLLEIPHFFSAPPGEDANGGAKLRLHHMSEHHIEVSLIMALMAKTHLKSSPELISKIIRSTETACQKPGDYTVI